MCYNEIKPPPSNHPERSLAKAYDFHPGIAGAFLLNEKAGQNAPPHFARFSSSLKTFFQPSFFHSSHSRRVKDSPFVNL